MGKTILVCDDEENILEVVKIILEQNDFTVFTCNEEKNIKDSIHKFHPDLIYLDIWMSSKNITQVMKELREEFGKDLPPIVLISALNTIEKIATECFADGFLPKPFTLEDLVSMTNKYIKTNI